MTNQHQFVTSIEQINEQMTTRFGALEQRLQALEGDTAELRSLLRAIIAGIERLSARLPSDCTENSFDIEEQDDGFLTAPPGQFLH
ncbi:MAG: hypothetical protein WCK65_02300 [Rhodospirillaceae bacterium]